MVGTAGAEQLAVLIPESKLIAYPKSQTEVHVDQI